MVIKGQDDTECSSELRYLDCHLEMVFDVVCVHDYLRVCVLVRVFILMLISLFC